MSTVNRYALHALLALNLALAIVLAWQWIGPDGRPRDLRWQAPAPQTTDYAAMLPQIPGAAPLDTGAFMALLERPLFTITRRPPPPPPPPQSAEAPPPDTLGTARLTGLYTGQGEGGIILNIGGKDRRVRVREQIEGWTLSAVDERGATFVSGSSQRTLPLLKGKLTTFTGQEPVAVPPPTRAAPSAQQVAPERATPASPAQPGGARPRPQPVFGGSIR